MSLLKRPAPGLSSLPTSDTWPHRRVACGMDDVLFHPLTAMFSWTRTSMVGSLPPPALIN